MADLMEQIVLSTGALRGAWTGLQGVSRSAIPPTCYQQWTKRAMLYQSLEGTSQIIPIRQVAWNSVKSIATAKAK